ncbi:hypothetical protein ACIXNN_04265 [Bacteroides fragilis]
MKDIASAPVGRVKVYRIFFPSPQAVEFLSSTFLVPVKVVCPLEAVTVYATEIAAADESSNDWGNSISALSAVENQLFLQKFPSDYIR